MMRISISRTVFLPLALVMAALPLAAQAGTDADATLAGRMQAFLREVTDTPNAELAAFFPRRGDWTWVQALRDPRGDAIQETGIWRFPGAETPRAIGEGGPVCASFDASGGVGPYEGRLGMQSLMHRGPWRRVRGTRFVPAGEPAASPVFVEWRREDGAWVVSAFGDVDFHRVPARHVPAAWRDTTGVPEDAAFAPADWYMITLNGQRYPKYGNPRPVDRPLLERIGLFQGVSVFAPRDENPDWPSVVYLPTAPGEFQPYQAPHGPYVCR